MAILNYIPVFGNNGSMISKEEFIHELGDVLSRDHAIALFHAIQNRRFRNGSYIDAKDYIYDLDVIVQNLNECVAFIDAFRHHSVRYKGMRGEMSESFALEWRKVTENLLVEYIDELHEYTEANAELCQGRAFNGLRDKMQMVPKSKNPEGNEGLIADNDLDKLCHTIKEISGEMAKLKKRIDDKFEHMLKDIFAELPHDFPEGRTAARKIYEMIDRCGILPEKTKKDHEAKNYEDVYQKEDYIRSFIKRDKERKG